MVVGYPGVIGAIDGTHIPMSRPLEEPDVYINRKGYTSVNMLALVDCDGWFRFCSVGCPGSFHDARVFRLSTLPRPAAVSQDMA